jgi:hypothetical protein
MKVLFLALALVGGAAAKTVPLMLWSNEAYFSGPSYVLDPLASADLSAVAAAVSGAFPSPPDAPIQVDPRPAPADVVVALVADVLGTEQVADRLASLEAEVGAAVSSAVAPFARFDDADGATLSEALARFAAGGGKALFTKEAHLAEGSDAARAFEAAGFQAVDGTGGLKALGADGATDVVVRPVTLASAAEAVRAARAELGDDGRAVFLLTALGAPPSALDAGGTVSATAASRKLLMAGGARASPAPHRRRLAVGDNCGFGQDERFQIINENGDCVSYTYGSWGVVSGLMFLFFWLSALILGFTCFDGMQTPSQFWLHNDLPLKGKLDE